MKEFRVITQNEKDQESPGHEGPVTVHINGQAHTFPTDEATGAQLIAAAGASSDYSLYLKEHGANEPIPASEQVELNPSQHFFTRPPSNVS
jgi:multiubiquitin